ncbi:hypothetical protein [Paenibacillus solani]|nr:hypothetical protein [Paenibacillus solani]
MDQDEGKRIITFIVIVVIIYSFITGLTQGDGGDNEPVIVG